MGEQAEQIIIGIDPGTNGLGYGVLKVTGRKVEAMAMGVIDLRKVSDVYLKLGRIFERVNSIIEAFSPDILAIESPFCGKNVQTMLKLGRAQGVVMAAAINHQIPVVEYAPSKIKQAVTGNGAATKEMVQRMLIHRLALTEETLLPYFDATDALAAALCHHLQAHSPLATLGPAHKSGGRAGSWSDFVKQHTDRIHR